MTLIAVASSGLPPGVQVIHPPFARLIAAAPVVFHRRKSGPDAPTPDYPDTICMLAAQWRAPFVPWQKTPQSNGPVTRSIPGGVARRSPLDVIIATRKSGRSARAMMSGDRLRRGAASATTTGTNRSGGIVTQRNPDGACGCSAHRWRTCSSGIVTWTICETGSGHSSSVLPISTGYCSPNDHIWRAGSRPGAITGPNTSGSERPSRTSTSPKSASGFCWTFPAGIGS